MSEIFDAVVIGAGPAGLAAATLLAQQHANVVLLDEQAAPGGQIYRGLEAMTLHQPDLFDRLGPDFAQGDELLAKFRVSGATYRPGHSVWQIVAGTPHEVWASHAGGSSRVDAKCIVLATGAMERPVPIPGWTLPGVMGAGAVQALLKSAALAPEGLVLAGAGPLLYLLGTQCLAIGAKLTALLDTTPQDNRRAALWQLPGALRGMGPSYLLKGLSLKGRLRRSGVRLYRGVTELRAIGTAELTDVSFRCRGRTVWLSTDLLGLHEGVIPAQQVPRSLGCAFSWDGVQHCFRPRVDGWGQSSVAGVLIAGDGAGIGGARAAEFSGRIAAAEVLRQVGRVGADARDAMAATDLRARAAHLAIRPFLDRLYAPPAWVTRPADETVICRCEEITAGAVRAVVRQGCQGPNQAKSFLRVGMGPCQGRMCGPVVSEVLAQARGVELSGEDYFRVRPPLTPITVAALAGLASKPAAGG